MNVYIDRTGKPDDGIVFQRGLMEFWVPSTMQPHLPYNPRHLPVIPLDVVYGGYTWKWVTIVNRITHQVVRYWDWNTVS